jgi:hypothetical protein
MKAYEDEGEKRGKDDAEEPTSMLPKLDKDQKVRWCGWFRMIVRVFAYACHGPEDPTCMLHKWQDDRVSNCGCDTSCTCMLCSGYARSAAPKPHADGHKHLCLNNKNT